MLEAFRTYILGEWQVISHAPATLAMLIIVIGLVFWAVFNWAYGKIVANQASEIKLIERHNKDFERQVEALQKRPTSISSDLVDVSDLLLQVHGDERAPTRLSYDNIWRWYYLRVILVAIEQEGGKEHRNAVATLFVSFDNPVKVGTLEVSAQGFALPSYEVKEFTNRYAIVVFSRELPAGILRVRVY
jgi:hypothetical protein